MTLFNRSLIIAIATLLASSGEALATSTATGNLSVSVNVANVCTISSPTLSFGSHTRGANHDVSANFSVACTNGTTGVITLDEGANADSSSTPAAPVRRMANGASYITYSLSAVSAGGAEWDALTGSEYVSSSSAASNVTVYGRIPTGQDVPAGDYTDTVLATITY